MVSKEGVRVFVKKKQVFTEIKEASQSAESLNFDDKSHPLIISTGASATHAGDVLEQEHKFDGNIEPKTQEFCSKAFPYTTQVRSTFQRKLKDLYMAVKSSKFRIQGITLIVKKNHSVIVNAIENIVEENATRNRSS